jgi:alkanesulfonate monooxygenase SsuD/methylene tetrahydromethanopterin reductase-like flavin-dependent oxidoreductase (luciferase family)
VYAEELGFDTAWLAELHFNPLFSIMPAPLLVAAALAQRTTRLRLGAAVLVLPNTIVLAPDKRMLLGAMSV